MSKPLSQIISERYDRILAKVPGRDPKQQFARFYVELLPWELNYVIAIMHLGCCENGGDAHGFLCMDDCIDDVISAWREIGALDTAKSLLAAKGKVIISYSDSEDTETKGSSENDFEWLEAYFDTLPGEDDEQKERLLCAYYERHCTEV